MYTTSVNTTSNADYGVLRGYTDMSVCLFMSVFSLITNCRLSPIDNSKTEARVVEFGHQTCWTPQCGCGSGFVRKVNVKVALLESVWGSRLKRRISECVVELAVFILRTLVKTSPNSSSSCETWVPVDAAAVFDPTAIISEFDVSSTTISLPFTTDIAAASLTRSARQQPLVSDVVDAELSTTYIIITAILLSVKLAAASSALDDDEFSLAGSKLTVMLSGTNWLFPSFSFRRFSSSCVYISIISIILYV